MSKPQLVVVNTEKELEERKLDKQPLTVECLIKGCGHRWYVTIGKFRDDPHCPKCGSEV